MAPQALRFDEIGYWSQLKLEIVKDYATAYSKILANQPRLKHVYIDAFAGAGVHQLKTTGALVPGSPLNALAVEPPFTELHLIDMDGAKVENLRQLTAGRSDVHIHQGNCNEILLRDVFPKVQYRDFKRALCLLDPYGLTLNWTVIAEAAKTKTTEIFLNFPIMDMNRNALWSTPTGVTDADRGRMSALGRRFLAKGGLQGQKTLFGGDDLVKDGGNRAVVDAFRRRLREVAGFKEVPEPIPMRNSKGATVYYLFFAAHNTVGAKIARHLMKRYANVGAG